MKKYALTLMLFLSAKALLAQVKLDVQDTRATPTLPNTYNYTIQPHFKATSVLGLSSAGYYNTILGIRGWGDDSGGKAHELAFADDSKIYIRSGFDATGWGGWRSLLVSDESGNFGIGNITPTQKISVAGNILSSVASNEGAAIWLENPNKTGNNLAYRWSIYNMTGPYGNSLQFWSYNQDATVMGPKLVIGDNGNIGIGTASPTDMLTVAGKIGAREIKVTTNAGADFVFEPGYKLPDLAALEKFVKTNKHLPEIPTAQQMVDNGVNLGELNIKLLQKVEELTLHLIEKDKQLITEKKTNKKQQQQIDQVIKELTALKKNIKH